MSFEKSKYIVWHCPSYLEFFFFSSTQHYVSPAFKYTFCPVDKAHSRQVPSLVFQVLPVRSGLGLLTPGSEFRKQGLRGQRLDASSPDSQGKAPSPRPPGPGARQGTARGLSEAQPGCTVRTEPGGGGPRRNKVREVLSGPRSDSGGAVAARLPRGQTSGRGSRGRPAPLPSLTAWGYLQPVGGAALPVCAGPRPPGRRSREVGEGAKEAETAAAAARPGSERGTAWSGRRGSAGCGRCCSAPAAAGWPRPRVSAAAGARGGGGRGREASRGAPGAPRRGWAPGAVPTTPRARGRRRLPRPARGGGTGAAGFFRIPGGRGGGGAGGRRLVAALPSVVGKRRA